jgi:uncharacterized protein
VLLVPVRFGPSRIHGLGVFAVDPIPRGTMVWRFTPGFDLDQDPAMIDSLPPPARSSLLHYGYIDPRLKRYILCCDDARFINHSETPSLRSDFTGERHGVDIAVHDIAPGEELTLDYRVVDGSCPQPQSP